MISASIRSLDAPAKMFCTVAGWRGWLIQPRSHVVEKTFAQNSAFTLIASRFIPGTRLPTYLAAGLFAMPARRFALITAIGALLWISVFFALTKLLGSHAVVWFTFTQTKIAAFVFTALLLLSVALHSAEKFSRISILRQITRRRATLDALGVLAGLVVLRSCWPSIISGSPFVTAV